MYTRITNFIKLLYSYRFIIGSMALQEIKRRYAGTLGGFVWAVIHPLMMIIVYWVVFSVGFKVKPMGDVPFIVVFCCGMIPWMTFSESVTMSANSIIAVPHLVSKTVFPVGILPLIQVITGMISHGLMLIILAALLIFNNISLSFWNLQVFYYIFALCLFALGLGWFVAALNVFYRDLAQILTVILNIWFWSLPIVWPPNMVPEKYQFLIKLNPMNYIIEGYRNSFITHTPFWNDAFLGAYFWVVCIVTLLIGAVVFSKLKSEFAEVI
jgi:ABC-type polysaccharide/polyol phosphate export permease